eukprot:TRINITY_DN2535_c0_g1_i1.p2 TRINITY_DN2535_c0_g1~~TRINITY_DN2535_c0_g1_i1.p2  ORF type:complete len:673 (+),score=237.80 TRINITY_DN2535_c0_g1_i1:88-2106(+)
MRNGPASPESTATPGPAAPAPHGKAREAGADAESEAMTEEAGRSTDDGEQQAKGAGVTVSAATSVPQQLMPEPKRKPQGPPLSGRKAAQSPSSRVRRYGSDIPPTTDAIKKGVPDALRARKVSKGSASARGQPTPVFGDKGLTAGYSTPKPKTSKTRSLTPAGRERKGLSGQPAEEYMKRRSQTPVAQTRGLSGVMGFLSPTATSASYTAQPARSNSLTFKKPETVVPKLRTASRSGERYGGLHSSRGASPETRHSPRSAATMPAHSKPAPAVLPVNPPVLKRGINNSNANTPPTSSRGARSSPRSSRTPPVSARNKINRRAPHSSLTSTFDRPVSALPTRSATMTAASPGPGFRTPKPKPVSIFPATLPLPPRPSKYKITVVFDLDQTLVNAHNVDDTIVPRPDMLACLEEIGACGAERIMWTASNEAQARFVLKKLPGLAALFDYIVTWDTHGWGDRRDYVKDILVLGRPATSALVIDNDHLVVRPHVNNALIVDDYGDLKGGNIPDVCDVMARLTMFVQCLTAMRPEIDVPAFIKAHGDWVEIKKKVGYYRLMMTEEVIDFVPSTDDLVHHNYPNEDGTYDDPGPPAHGELRVEYYRALQERIPADDTPIDREIHAPAPKKLSAKRHGQTVSMTFAAPVAKPKTARGFQRTSTVKKRSETPPATRYHMG